MVAVSKIAEISSLNLPYNGRIQPKYKHCQTRNFSAVSPMLIFILFYVLFIIIIITIIILIIIINDIIMISLLLILLILLLLLISIHRYITQGIHYRLRLYLSFLTLNLRTATCFFFFFFYGCFYYYYYSVEAVLHRTVCF